MRREKSVEETANKNKTVDQTAENKNQKAELRLELMHLLSGYPTLKQRTEMQYKECCEQLDPVTWL